jgi:hypothetical protein
MLAGMIARPRATSLRTNSGSHVLADRDEAHLLGDEAAPRVVHLREVAVAARMRASIHGCAASAGRGVRSWPCGPVVS